jgi:hypothetical protein
MPRSGLRTPGNELVPIEWTLWPVWTCEENLAHNWTRIPGPSSRQRLAIAVTLSRPTKYTLKINFNITLPSTPMPPEVTLLFRFSNKHFTLLSPILRVLISYLLYVCYINSNSIVLDLCHITDSENKRHDEGVEH